MAPMAVHLRIARPTDRLEQVARMYEDGLGLERLGGFTDHEGFDGVLLGERGAGYHLEFTHHRGTEVGRSPSEDHLLVFYYEDRAEWEAACRRAEAAGFVPVAAYNPYWDKHGRTFEDPDGYRVVLHAGPPHESIAGGS